MSDDVALPLEFTDAAANKVKSLIADEDNPNIIEGASSWFDIQAPHEITFNLDGEPLSGQNFHIEILPAALRCRLPPDCPLLR